MHKNQFVLTRNVKIETDIMKEPVRRAISRFYRDLAMVLLPVDEVVEKAARGASIW